ncbi:prenyltransferase/squalene oxidase repeat-containing protein [Nonomuraea dietziae]|uniref:prenyltransferase/squalene oxidase repeat-containing protein n=1 Tax=Nonomuraea dietziae TaxID=65515 RepID=UPI0034096FFB
MNDIASAARELVDGLMARPWGQVTASVYETGRLVTLVPWLTGHAERVDYLLRTQRPDGAWGPPDGYDLVPTLSAVEALMSECRRTSGASDTSTGPRADLSAAVLRGLEILPVRLGAGHPLPDMPAVELIVPFLVSLINEHLTGLGAPLPLPQGMDHSRLEAVRGWIASGAKLPEKLLHALEIAGSAARGAHAVRPTPIGTVGASPAATAAWLAAIQDGPVHADLTAEASGVGETTLGAAAARLHLEAVARRHGGPVPVGLPITVFERGWVLSWLARAGIELDVPPEMIADLRAAIGPAGTPAGAGLPADADTTSVALYALAMLGAPHEPGSLLAFDLGTHFCTWQGEDGHSPTVNAHVLDALGKYVERRPAAGDRYRPVMARLGSWLASRQRADGAWDDRWHASPYYATASCALALDDYGSPENAGSVRRAVAWVLDTQRPDGSWGRWEGTPEESAYALQILLMTRAGDDPRLARAAAEGYRFLRGADLGSQPALWHDKDLYSPRAVVRAAVLASLHLAECDRRVSTLIRS